MPKGSLGRFLVRSAWWQCVSPGTENYCVREHWAMLSPWTTPAEQSLGNLQSGRHNEKEKKHQSGEKHLCASSQLSEKAPLATTSAGVSREIAHLQWGGCRPGREPSPSLSSVYRSPCTLCTGPACSSCLDLFSPLSACSGWAMSYNLPQAEEKWENTKTHAQFISCGHRLLQTTALVSYWQASVFTYSSSTKVSAYMQLYGKFC